MKELETLRDILKFNYSSRKLIMTVVLVVLSTIMVFNQIATFSEWTEFMQWIFLVYVFGNVGTKLVNHLSDLVALKNNNKQSEKENEGD